MNTIWSDYIQGIDTLYFSRSLRFSDEYKNNYMNIFNIDDKSRILEIGCGPGAFTQSLSRWYPNSEIIGIDQDSSFIKFARLQAPHINFLEADATKLPFEDNFFDVVISNTVQEHIEPSKFFKEQYRVLKEGGICIVLSIRKGIEIMSDCILSNCDYEKEIWNRVEDFNKKIIQDNNVGKYAKSEKELPIIMEKYGFKDVSTDYLTINLTPDNPKNSKDLAHSMINACRHTNLDAINSLRNIKPKIVSEEEILKMLKIVNKKYDKRIELYDKGIKQWDTKVSLIMILRGKK